MRLQRALHSGMFTSKYRVATGTLEASHSGWFQTLTRLGGSQSSKGTTAAFRGTLMRSATSGTLMTSWHQVVDSDPDTESHEDLPAIGETQLTIKTSDQKPLLHGTDACGRACRRQKLTGEMRLAESVARRARDHHRREWSAWRIHTSMLEDQHRRR